MIVETRLLLLNVDTVEFPVTIPRLTGQTNPGFTSTTLI